MFVSGAGRLSRRRRWVVSVLAVAAVVAAASVAPVGHGASGPGPSERAVDLMARVAQEGAALELRRRERLAAPEAVARRERSKRAFSGLTRREVLELAQVVFS